MENSFVLRAHERGYNKLLSTGPSSSYVAGHPEATITRHSSFDFGPYQSGRRGFGRVRVFGDEVFRGAGCGYNMHPHHNFIICAFVLEGQLTHVNTVGNVDQLGPGDYYAFSAGSGGKHCELNLRGEDANMLYVWILPDQLLLPPSYARARFDAAHTPNRLVTLVGNADGAVRISQDVKISRLSLDPASTCTYRPSSSAHGVYAFMIDGSASINNLALGRRDSLGVWGGEPIPVNTDSEDADVFFVETAP
jgi:redox-sensitive bicupin YhaK (pirin superfamily)